MQKARIRTSWKNKQRNVSVEEHAVAVAAVAWRVSLNAAKNLHEQDFVYEDDQQRLQVIREYLYFLIHVADRIMHTHFADIQSDSGERVRFMTKLSHECRRHYLENARELVAHGLNSDQFINQLNQRMNNYASTRFVDDEPGYDTFRTFGLFIQDCMGNSQTNKWAQDQVLDIDGPEAFGIFSKALTSLNKSAAGSGLVN